MRLTARALSVTALTGAALGAAASAAFADPAAEVSPGSVEPGGTVDISVTCDAVGGTPPEFIDATSQGFEGGKVQLRRVQGNEQSAAGASAAGATYRGTARITPDENVDVGTDAADPGSERGVDGACPVAPGGQPKKWTASYTVARRATAALGTVQDPPTPQREEDSSTSQREDSPTSQGEDSSTTSQREDSPTSQGEDSSTTSQREDSSTSQGEDSSTTPQREDSSTSQREEGSSTSQREEGSSTSQREEGSSTSQREDSPSSQRDEGPPTVQHGVEAGEGGVFSGSVPMLIAGSVLIAGALGAAAHRLCGKVGSTDR